MSSENVRESDLASRIRRHLKERPFNEKVVLLWQGYLAGLFEWGKIDLKTYEHLDSMLPNIASEEVAELFLEPDWIEKSELNDEDYYKKINDSSDT